MRSPSPVRYGSDWRLAQKVFQSVAEEVTGDYAIRSREAWKNVVRRHRIEEARSEGRIRVATASFELLSAPGLEVRLATEARRMRTAKVEAEPVHG